MAGVADWGTVQVGRLILRENFTVASAVNASTGDRTITITGEESMPPLTAAEARQRQSDILGLQGKFLPVIFTNKSNQNGWYTVTDTDTNLTNWTGEASKFTWQIQAVRVGAETSIDIESRMTYVVRVNSYAQSGERWHAPSASAYAYFTGSTVPSAATRALANSEGTLTLYRGTPAGVSPRWGSSLANYGLGRARVRSLTLGSMFERSAINVSMSASAGAFELSNSLLMVTPGASATLQISAWNGTQWNRIDWNATVSGSASGALTNWSAATITRNDYEVCTVRLIKDLAPGRVTLDLSLRRGARFVETYLQTGAAGTLSWYRATAEAGTAPASTGYVSATANDANGDRYIIGGATTWTAQLGQGGITKPSATALDAFIGSVVGGSGATGADTAAVTRDHYMMAISEVDMGVRR